MKNVIKAFELKQMEDNKLLSTKSCAASYVLMHVYIDRRSVNFQTVPLFSSFSRFARVLLLLPFVMSWDFSFDLI